MENKMVVQLIFWVKKNEKLKIVVYIENVPIFYIYKIYKDYLVRETILIMYTCVVCVENLLSIEGWQLIKFYLFKILCMVGFVLYIFCNKHCIYRIELSY